jgi:hypothetical protein
MVEENKEQQFLRQMEQRADENDKGEFLYNWPGLNYRGRAPQSKKPYVQIVAEQLLHSTKTDYFDNLKKSKRKTYAVASHNADKAYESFNSKESERKEEKFALQMYLASKEQEHPFGELGEVFDYQVPLKASSKDRYGKIDLVSIQDNDLWLIELKLFDSKETLLRALLEIESYERILNHQDYRSSYKGIDLANKKIRKAVLIGCHTMNDVKVDAEKTGSTIMDDVRHLENSAEHMLAIQKLLEEYQIEVFVVDGIGPKYYESKDITHWQFGEVKRVRWD